MQRFPRGQLSRPARPRSDAVATISGGNRRFALRPARSPSCDRSAGRWGRPSRAAASAIRRARGDRRLAFLPGDPLAHPHRPPIPPLARAGSLPLDRPYAPRCF